MIGRGRRLFLGALVHLVWLITPVLSNAAVTSSSANVAATNNLMHPPATNPALIALAPIQTALNPVPSTTPNKIATTKPINNPPTPKITSIISTKTSPPSTTVESPATSAFTKIAIQTSSIQTAASPSNSTAASTPLPFATSTTKRIRTSKKPTHPTPKSSPVHPQPSKNPSPPPQPPNGSGTQRTPRQATQAPGQDIAEEEQSDSDPTGIIVAVLLILAALIVVAIIGGFVFMKKRDKKKKPPQKKTPAPKAKFNRSKLQAPQDFRKRGPRPPNADPDADISLMTTESLMNRLSERRNEFFAQKPGSIMDSGVSQTEPEGKKSAKSPQNQPKSEPKSDKTQLISKNMSISIEKGSPGQKPASLMVPSGIATKPKGTKAAESLKKQAPSEPNSDKTQHNTEMKPLIPLKRSSSKLQAANNKQAPSEPKIVETHHNSEKGSIALY